MLRTEDQGLVAIKIEDWHCPLSPMPARYTSVRRDNFDIFLLEWIGRL